MQTLVAVLFFCLALLKPSEITRRYRSSSCCASAIPSRGVSIQTAVIDAPSVERGRPWCRMLQYQRGNRPDGQKIFEERECFPGSCPAVLDKPIILMLPPQPSAVGRSSAGDGQGLPMSDRHKVSHGDTI